MPIEILMPALSPTMTEGTLARWLKKEGDTIKSGDLLAEIETDKATMELEAVDEGVLGKILVTDGTAAVAVNAPIALLLEEGEEVSALENMSASPKVNPVAKGNEIIDPQVVARLQAMIDNDNRTDAVETEEKDRIFASPLAKRIATQKGIDIATISGSGPHGRVIKVDVESSNSSASAVFDDFDVALAAAVLAQSNPFSPAYVEEKISSMRRIIASRLVESKSSIPHFYLTADCDVDALMKIRAELNGRSDQYKLSINDFVVRAVALALKKIPAANVSWGENIIYNYTEVDIAVAVATDGGLITPVVRQADHKGLAEISAEIKSLVSKAKKGKLSPEEYQGGGFTISNLGMYGVKEFSAIINPPQACIMAVGAAEKRPVVKDGALAIATVMTCTLSIDHRVVDGAVGAQFMAVFKSLIEDPLSMLL